MTGTKVNRFALSISAGVMLGCSATGPKTAGNGGGSGLSVYFTSQSVSQGTPAYFVVTLPPADYSGAYPLVVTLGGVGSGTLSFSVPPDPTGAPLDGQINIPSAAIDGVLTLQASIPLLNQFDSTSIQIRDEIPPNIANASLSTPLSSVLLANTTDTIKVSATDNHLLAWVGWTLNPAIDLADSVAVSGLADSASIPIVIPASLIGDTLTLNAFATDADDNHALASLSGLLVLGVDNHPTLSAARGARIVDVAFDTARGLIYLAKPDSQKVAVLALHNMTYQTPITFTGSPVSIDLTPGGDSLIVGIASPPSIAIVNLMSSARPIVGTLRVDSASVPDTLTSLRVAADNRVIALVTRYESSPTGVSIELNLANGIRQAVDSQASGCTSRVTGSIDRTHLLLAGCPTPGNDADASTIYESATHSFTTAAYGFVAGSPTFTSANLGGSVYQLSEALFDSTMTQQFSVRDRAGYGAAIAPNGNDFFVGDCAMSQTQPCPDTGLGLYMRYAPPNTQPVEVVVTPHPVYELTVSPTGKTLVGISADTIMAIDLTQSTPASARVLARLHSVLQRLQVGARTPSRHPAPASQTFTIRLAGRSMAPLKAAPDAAHRP